MRKRREIIEIIGREKSEEGQREEGERKEGERELYSSYQSFYS